jgi:hypothetical protein
MKKLLTNRNIALWIVFLGVYSVLLFLYYRQFTSFIFFDEVANIVAGKLLLQGKQLYSEQFFNHQMLIVYLSSLIQFITKPDSLYQVIMYHRLFVFAVSFVAGIFLVSKLKWYGLGILVIYEFTKYYLFGYLFLAEGLIVYIHMFLFYLGWKKLSQDTISPLEIWIATFGAWFVVWSREPYIPLILGLYLTVLFNKNIKKIPRIPVLVFIILSAVVLISVPLQEYFYQVIYVNYKTVFSDQISANSDKNLGIFSLFFYPIFSFFSGTQTFFRLFLILVSSVFLISFGYYVYNTKKWIVGVYVFVILALANVRMVQPGTIYYSAFYQIQWMGLILVATGLFIQQIMSLNKKLAFVLIGVLGIAIGYAIIQPDSYVVRRIDRAQLFASQYDKYYVTANTVDTLANQGDTLHVDFSESLLYWESNTPAKFKYHVYYPVMGDIEEYKQQRLDMFINDPPTFYYRDCLEAKNLFYELDEKIRYKYAPIQYVDQVNCLYVLKDVAKRFSPEKLEDIKANGYRLDPSSLR